MKEYAEAMFVQHDALKDHRQWYTEVTDAVLKFCQPLDLTKVDEPKVQEWVAVLALLCRSPGIGEALPTIIPQLKELRDTLDQSQKREADLRTVVAYLMLQQKVEKAIITEKDLDIIIGKSISFNLDEVAMTVTIHTEAEGVH